MTELSPFRQRLYDVIFGTESRAGKLFDLALIIAIFVSVAAVMLDSIAPLSVQYKRYFIAVEWFFTILFTLEYFTRIYCSPRPLAYMFGFFGIVDLLSILPTYFALFFPDVTYLLVIRLMRVLRIFRVLKLVRYMTEENILIRALMSSRRKVFVFFSSVLVMATIIGALMFIIEGPDNGFTNIPKSIYWTVVTITTVGYGDITPHTVAGQILAVVTMLLGYSIIAVPTGIITAELAQEIQRDRSIAFCRNCSRGGHEKDAQYCKYCGAPLERPD